MPTPLRSYVNGRAEVQVSGANVAEAMESLFTQYPALRPHLTQGNGQLRTFVNLFLGTTNIRDLQGLQTPLDEGDVLKLVPAIAGG